MAPPVRTIFLGSGAFGLPTLEHLEASPLVDLVAVVTAPPRPAGRTRALRPTPIAEAAEVTGTTVLTPSRLRDPGTLARLEAAAPELVVLADYGRLVPPDVLELPAHGALNLHPSLLPRHRGASPVPAAILAGDVETGVTLMRMDEGLDTGPIVAQAELALARDETTPELEARLARMAARLLATWLPDWLAGRLESRPQPSEGATLTRPLRREDGRLDPNHDAATLERQVRALQPWPGTFLEVDGGRLIVRAASSIEAADASDGPASSVASSSSASSPVGSLIPYGDGLALVTASGPLELLEVQPAGGRPMSGAAYRRGRRI